MKEEASISKKRKRKDPWEQKKEKERAGVANHTSQSAATVKQLILSPE